ncbi:hypothetical protein [Aeromicrobium sp. UC242_57]|uniref:hypothetical protein n=1 Tax=Aeromicrobium sp. UC242_57 TaxID=3374624 RepID=UPI0037886D86
MARHVGRGQPRPRAAERHGRHRRAATGSAAQSAHRSWYGGGYDDYEAAIAAEQEVAERTVRAAEADVRAQKRELAEAQTKLARSARQGRQQADSLPKILAGARKRAAQETAGRVTGVHQDRLATATSQLDEAEARLRDDAEIRIDLPATAVPPSRSVLSAVCLRPPHGSVTLDLDIRGPERIALTGANGTGKTSALRTIIGEPPRSTARCTSRCRSATCPNASTCSTSR